MVHLSQINRVKETKGIYPETIRIIQGFESFTFEKEVSIFVGDNGSGKTTFIKLLATLLGIPRINPQRTEDTAFLNCIDSYQAIYNLNKVSGFFFQGEEFIQYLQYLRSTLEMSYQELERINIEYCDRSQFSINQARMPHLRTINEIKSLYAYSLTERSHGEGFLDFFKSRLRSNQIFLLDEPETPLSFNSQLTMIALIKEAVNEGSQFIIATHSPILMAYPDADIYEIVDGQFRKQKYEDLEVISSLRYFLNNPSGYLKYF